MLPFTSVYGGENPYQNPALANPSKKRFTSYDRSAVTTLDYAVNRYYSAQQGRFTQVDPIGMASSELANPQSLNLYAYVENNPINSADPLGLDGPTVVFRPFPIPPGGGSGGSGGLKLGPFSFSFSFGGGSFLNFGSLQQSKKGSSKAKAKVERKVGKVGDIGIIIVSSEEPKIGVETGPSYNFGLPPLSSEERKAKLRETLDIMGMIPGYGTVFNVGSGLLSLKEGDYAGFGLSMAAIIPGGRFAARVAKYLRKAAKAAKMGNIGARRIIAGTEGLIHSFDSHAAQWFGRPVGATTHLEQWQALIERAAASGKQVPWMTGADPTVGHLARIDGKYIFVEFFTNGPRAGQLATAIVPDQVQLNAILRLLK
jgi:RHS repeat-associated protein